MVLQQMSQHSQHQSTGRILVPRGPFVLSLDKDCLNTSSSSKTFRQGGNAWNPDFDAPSAAVICVDAIKCYSIPSVPSRLEGG